MDNSSLLALTHNAALLLAMIFIYELTTRHKSSEQFHFWSWTVPMGLWLGATSIVIILTHRVYSPSLVFATRSVLSSISGLFFRAAPTVIAMLMAAASRF